MDTVGAFIFPAVWEAWDRAQADRALRALRDFRVNTIATESETYRDELIDLAHGLDLRFVGGISCFSEHGRNHQILHDRTELWPVLETGERRPLMEWYIGVTPTFADYREGRLELVERIMRDHELDGMCLDFVRWPLHGDLELRPGAPEPLDSSFDPHTVSQFLEFAGLEAPAPLDAVPALARWIRSEHRARWVDYKCHVIADFVAQARERVRAHRPAAQTGAYLVPAPDERRSALVGQRVRELAPVTDFLAPMVYHPVLHRTPAWVQDSIDEIVRHAPGKAQPVLQVDSAEGTEMGADWGPAVPAEEWREVACHVAERIDILGFVAFTGTALFANQRGEILSECLRSNALTDS
jgi:hypothetical protein